MGEINQLLVFSPSTLSSRHHKIVHGFSSRLGGCPVVGWDWNPSQIALAGFASTRRQDKRPTQQPIFSYDHSESYPMMSALFLAVHRTCTSTNQPTIRPTNQPTANAQPPQPPITSASSRSVDLMVRMRKEMSSWWNPSGSNRWWGTHWKGLKSIMPRSYQ